MTTPPTYVFILINDMPTYIRCTYIHTHIDGYIREWIHPYIHTYIHTYIIHISSLSLSICLSISIYLYVYTYYIQRNKLRVHSFTSQTGLTVDIYTTMLTLGSHELTWVLLRFHLGFTLCLVGSCWAAGYPGITFAGQANIEKTNDTNIITNTAPRMEWIILINCIGKQMNVLCACIRDSISQHRTSQLSTAHNTTPRHTTAIQVCRA